MKKAYISPNVGIVNISTADTMLGTSTVKMDINNEKSIDNTEALGKKHNLWDNDDYSQNYDPWE